jgi:phage tail sheath gpL-like
MMTFSLVPLTAAASQVFIEQENIRRTLGSLIIGEKVLAPGQYNTGKTPTVDVPQLITSKNDAWTRYGRGSMLAAMYEIHERIAPWVPFYALPLADAGAGVAAVGSILVASAVTVAGVKAIFIGGRKITVTCPVGTADATAVLINAAINAALDLPVTSGVVTATCTLTARHKGTYGNGIKIEVDLDSGDLEAEPTGGALTITQIGIGTAGATDPPNVAAALAALGDIWYTLIAFPWNDSVNVGLMETAGTARVAPGIKRAFAGIVGSIATLADFTTWLGSRNSPWTTAIPVEAGSSPIYEIAAAAAARIAGDASADPARRSMGQVLTGIRGGVLANWTGAQKDAIVTAGGSWTRRETDGVVHLGDVITTYVTNTGGGEDAVTSWRYLTTILKMQAKVYSIDQLLAGDPFIRAIIISDSQVTGKAYAISPKTLKAYAIKLVDELWIPQCWSKDRDTIVAGIVAEINTGNPARMDLLIPDAMTAELAILGVKYEWGFSSAA